MISTVDQLPVPLFADADGVLRVGGTRVTLDTVITAFETGCTCEEIAQQYPSLALSDIYVVVSYYLTHREQLRTYLEQRAAAEERVRADAPLAPNESNLEIRDRLLKRRQTG